MTESPQGFTPLERSTPRFGVLGAARIVPKALLSAAPGLVEVTCLAARSPAKAEAFVAAHGIATHVSSYEELLNRADVDVVYVALPAALHAPWVCRALQAGKHVLCEKPFALSVTEANRCVELAHRKRLLLMEAHHSCYHPLINEVTQKLERLGSLRHVRILFNGPIQQGDIRLEPKLGAGVLLDFGCYLIQWQRLVTGECAPRIERAEAVQSPPEVDVSVSASLRTARGIGVELSCDMRPGISFQAFIEVWGEKGWLRWDNPLNGQDSHLALELRDAPSERIDSPGPSTYRAQLEVLRSALAAGRHPLTSGANIIETQTQLDALVRACGLRPRAELALD